MTKINSNIRIKCGFVFFILMFFGIIIYSFFIPDTNFPIQSKVLLILSCLALIGLIVVNYNKLIKQWKHL